MSTAVAFAHATAPSHVPFLLASRAAKRPPAQSRRNGRPDAFLSQNGSVKVTSDTPIRIGELAERAGVTVQAVRYYERRGLLTPQQRRASGYREYGPNAIERLRFVRRAQDLGFTLAEIGDLLALRTDPHTPAAAVKVRATEKIADIDRKIHDLEQIRHALTHLAGRCRGGRGPVGDCPLLEALGAIDY